MISHESRKSKKKRAMILYAVLVHALITDGMAQVYCTRADEIGLKRNGNACVLSWICI